MLTEKALKNAAYRIQSARFTKVTLKNGEYHSSAAPGSASQNVIRFKKALTGTFNGQLMAVVMLTSSTGKADPFYELALMAVREGKPVNVAGHILGGQIQVTDFRLDKEQIIIKMTVYAPKASKRTLPEHALKELKHQPPQNVEKIFGVKKGGLVLLKTLPPPSVENFKKQPKTLPPAPPKKEINAKKE